MTIEELIACTRNLEASVPKITGAFCDFDRIRAQYNQGQGRQATVVVGTIKAGKTTLVNALIGHDLLPRGSGVKSLVLTTISNDVSNHYEIQLRSIQGILQTLRHDFRILGCEFVPPGGGGPELIADIDNQSQRLVRSMEQDGRFNLETGLDSSQAIIHTAYVRIQKTLAGLKLLFRDFDQETVDNFTNYRPIIKTVQERDYFQRATGSLDLAALTEIVKLKVPYQGRLDPSVQIIDCQGSDSLNPLDISSVRSAFYLADRILYVINSRLGLRQGDRDLLRTIRNSKLTCPIHLAINVEHFEPRTVDDITSSCLTIKKEFETLIGRSAIDVYPVSALVELHQSLKTERPEEILGHWQVPHRWELNDFLARNFIAMAKVLAPGSSDPQADEAALLPILISHAAETASAILARDKDFGVSLTPWQQAELARMLQHVGSDEQKRLNASYQKMIDQVFAPSQNLYGITSGFLNSGSKAFFTAHPYDLNEIAVLDVARIYNFGSNQFLQEWLHLNLRLKDMVVPEILTALRHDLTNSAKALLRFAEQFLLNQCNVSRAKSFEFSQKSFDQFSEYLNQLLASLPTPDFVEPILIHDFRRAAVYAEVMTKNFWQKILDKASKQKNQQSKVKSLSDRCLQKIYELHFIAGKEYYELSLRSAQENYKFQYAYAVIEKALATLERTILSWVDGAIADQAKSALRQHPLLEPVERELVEKYLTQIEGFARSELQSRRPDKNP